MPDKDTVLEVKVEDASLTFHLDKEDGGNIVQAIEEIVEETEGLRWLGDFEIDEVYPIKEY